MFFLTQAGVAALRGVLGDLKEKAGEVAKRIKQLEVKTFRKVIELSIHPVLKKIQPNILFLSNRRFSL